MIPGNAADRIDTRTNTTRSTFELQPERRALPPMTPAIIRSLRDREEGRALLIQRLPARGPPPVSPPRPGGRVARSALGDAQRRAVHQRGRQRGPQAPRAELRG